MNEPFALIIEDDPDLSEIFSEALKMGGFNVELIQDGGLAIDRLNTCQPDLVVLDLHLPNVSGSAILKHIRAEKALKNTKVILATADARMADALPAKPDLVLIKPISFNQLRDLAKRLRLKKT